MKYIMYDFLNDGIMSEERKFSFRRSENLCDN